jgi:hypothetical protein
MAIKIEVCGFILAAILGIAALILKILDKTMWWQLLLIALIALLLSGLYGKLSMEC